MQPLINTPPPRNRTPTYQPPPSDHPHTNLSIAQPLRPCLVHSNIYHAFHNQGHKFPTTHVLSRQSPRGLPTVPTLHFHSSPRTRAPTAHAIPMPRDRTPTLTLLNTPVSDLIPSFHFHFQPTPRQTTLIAIHTRSCVVAHPASPVPCHHAQNPCFPHPAAITAQLATLTNPGTLSTTRNTSITTSHIPSPPSTPPKNGAFIQHTTRPNRALAAIAERQCSPHCATHSSYPARPKSPLQPRHNTTSTHTPIPSNMPCVPPLA